MDKAHTIAALARAPLLFDPGSDWEYGFSTDVLGFVVEAVTGMPFGDVLAQRLWSPLGMSDTSFALPAAKRSRYALALAKEPLTGEANPAIHHATDKTQRWHSGGGGAVSTAGDYLRFCEMLRSGGRLGSADILGRGTVALMTVDHLPASFVSKIADAMDPAASGYGFGLGFAVRRQDGIAAMDPPGRTSRSARAVPRCRGTCARRSPPRRPPIRRDRADLTADPNLRAARHHDVELVLGVRRLRIGRARLEDVQAARQVGHRDELVVEPATGRARGLELVEIPDIHGRSVSDGPRAFPVERGRR